MKAPNVLIFMTDHQRGDTVLPDGPAVMPNVARLRQQGVVFNQAFCPAPHCCPSRATFMTGLYPSQHGIWHNVDVANAITRELRPGVRTWSEDFRDAGYRMWYSGKWHVSHTESPVDRGWNVCPKTAGDYRDRAISDRWSTYQELAARPEPTGRAAGEIRTPGFPPYRLYGTTGGNRNDRVFVTEGCDALDRLTSTAGEGPWCLYVGCTGPHDPYNVPQEFLDLYDPESIRLPPNFNDDMRDKPGFYRRTRDLFAQLGPDEHRDAIRHYLAYCSYEDALFGQLLQRLDASGAADDTLVIYCSDHGDYMAEHGLWSKGVPCFRGAYHVPCVVRWPAGVRNPGRQVEAMVSLADVAPTLLEAAGIACERQMVGRSLLPFLRDEGLPADWRDAIFTQTNGNELYAIQRSVTTTAYKYVYNGFDYDELYDLREDPHEIVNLAADPSRRATVREAMQRIWRFAHETGDTCINPYIMVRFAPYGPAEAFRP